ncbi:hypothetical protein CPB84DRAFT_1746889 [Gymnopilus junonius]|uniref:Uncharacterized protein n=1 Tax=Gymnopilus junonius TaxID=109634 RepID=A0A9P5TMQ6_GYMJU|nr:hypothetical protein CPB84DRAFT_1746889 [Gymnopilus junonius]
MTVTSFFSSRKANSSAPPPRIDNSSASFEPGMREGEETVVYRPKDAHSGRDGAEEAETGKRDPRYVNANSSSDILHVTQRKLANAEEQLELEAATDKIPERWSRREALSAIAMPIGTRTSELKEAQTYLNNQTNILVRQSCKVWTINSEIFNLATNIIDLFEEGKKTDLFERNEQRDVVDRCSRIAKGAIGGLLYDFNCQIDEALNIRDPIVPESSVPLQLALQTILVAWTLEVFGTAGSLLDGHGELKDVYNLIQRQEEQSISSQWRAIAFRATKRLRKSSVNRAVERIMSVLIISGLSTTTSPTIPKSQKRWQKAFTALKKYFWLLKRSCAVDHFLRYGFEKVLCTVGLGLQRTTMKKTADKTFLPEIELLKRPEVVLESLLDDFKKPVDSEYGQMIPTRIRITG